MIFALFFPQLSQAVIVLDTDVFYFNDALSGSSDSNTNRLMYHFFLGFSLDRKDRLQLGWSYTKHTNDDETSSTLNYSSTQMGPGLLYYLNKRRTWRLGVYYHLKTDGTFQITGSAAEEWRGTAYGADLGYQLWTSQSLSFAARLNYSTATYNESFQSSAKTDVSYTRTMIYPSLGMTLEF